jgi:drug/metabolite transporter (DMT)-like permease
MVSLLSGAINVAKWAGFWLVGLIWGSSFLLIRVGVEELAPFQLVFIRTGIAAVGLNIVMLLRGKRYPANLRALLPLIIIGIGNTAVPFALITWGEKSVESGLASVLQASASLFTLVIAHFTFADERITLQKAIGLLLGFVGVIVLASRSWADGQLVTGNFLGQLAIIGASLCYATFTTYSRKVIQNRFEPIVVSAGAMTAAAVVSGVAMLAAPLFSGQPATPLVDLSSEVLNSVLALGLVNTFVAYLFYYWIVQELGAARASMVTYVVPAVGLALGVIFLNELLDLRLIIGAGLIFVAIGVVNVGGLRRLIAASPRMAG